MFTKTQIPLLKDHHSHPIMFAILNGCLSLDSAQTKEQALSWMKKGAEKINIILGWNNERYSFKEQELDQLPPVIICNTSFHQFLINKTAKKKLAHSHQEILTQINDESWVEKNLPKIMNLIVEIKSFNHELIKNFYHEIEKQGVWYAEEMLLPFEEGIYLFKEFGYFDRTRFWTDIETFDTFSQEAQADIFGIKIFTDGALGSETAALKAPYLTGKKGRLVYSDEELQTLITQVAKLNKAVALHAIGDKATEQIITVLSHIKNKQAMIPHTRIEHCQFISRHDAYRAKALGILLSMQPNFSIDSVQYQDRLPKKYGTQNNSFRLLIDEIGFVPGIDLIFGSDGIPHGIQNALESALFPPFPNQRLTLDEFIAGYCMPDTKQGYIEVTIDWEKQTLSTEVNRCCWSTKL